MDFDSIENSLEQGSMELTAFTLENETNLCEGKKKALKTLRKEALLNPKDKNLWDTLSCIYGIEKYNINSTYYKLTGLSTKPRNSFLTHGKEIISTLEIAKEYGLGNKSFISLMNSFRIRSLFFSDDELFLFLKQELESLPQDRNSSKFISHSSIIFGLAKFLRRKEDQLYFYNQGLGYKDDVAEESQSEYDLCTLVKETHEKEERYDNAGISLPKYRSLIQLALKIFYSSEDDDEEEILNLLIKGLKDPRLHVRRMALYYLSILRNDELKIKILNCLMQAEPTEPRNITSLKISLGRMLHYILSSLKNELKKKSFLEKVIEGEDYRPSIKASMIIPLQTLENEEVKKELLSKAFEQKSRVLKQTVMKSLLILEDNEEIKNFIEIGFRDSDLSLKCQALLSIRGLDNDDDKISFINRVLSLTESLLCDPNNLDIKALAMKVLWALSDEDKIIDFIYFGLNTKTTKFL